jgi:DNA-3-methyladenine glycosylase
MAEIVGKVLPKDFYKRRPDEVARDLLGKLIVRIYKGVRLAGIIVETEAYFGPEDPASRAKKGGDLARVMAGEVGHALIYGIHRQWLFNVVAHEEKNYGAVLIRAIQPIKGVELMKVLRGINSLRNLTNGPGKLTRALAIDKRFHRKPVYLRKGVLRIEEGIEVDQDNIKASYRIGVSEDLPEPLRFLIRGNKFVSKY